MIKKYLILTFLLVLFVAQNTLATNNNSVLPIVQDPIIEGLSVYPNPNNTGKVYITTKLNLEKKVEIFDVLGKKIIDVVLFAKELNISQLNPGVYIIKIKEGEATATRKLIIN
jgi:Secretion system C-terminal sorting domain